MFDIIAVTTVVDRSI